MAHGSLSSKGEAHMLSTGGPEKLSNLLGNSVECAKVGRLGGCKRELFRPEGHSSGVNFCSYIYLYDRFSITVITADYR